MTSISHNVFNGCTGLTCIVWKAKNCSIEGVYDYLFDGSSDRTRSQITEFIIDDSVQCVPDYLCIGMSKLTNIIIPESVKSIGKGAFEDCVRLKKIYNFSPLTLKQEKNTYGRALFNPNLVRDMSNYSLVDRYYIFSKDKARLLEYIGKETALILPSGSYSIVKNAFENMDFIQYITIPAAVIKKTFH